MAIQSPPTIADLDTSKRRVLGISNTYMKGQEWFAHVSSEIQELLGDVRRLVVLPYALSDRDWYTQRLSESFKKLGIEEVTSPHQYPGSEKAVINDAEAVYIAGGNTPLLVANLHGLRHLDTDELVDKRLDASQESITEEIKERVAGGMPLLGASAGWNVMFDDIRTTNDMHIAPWRLQNGMKVSCMQALGVFPKHMSGNPHYLENVPVTDEERERVIAVNSRLAQLIDHQGESREDRINRVIGHDPERIVLALREGACVVLEGDRMHLGGQTNGMVFRHNEDPRAIEVGEDLSSLLIK